MGGMPGGGSGGGEWTEARLCQGCNGLASHQCQRPQRHLGGGMEWWPVTSDHELTNLLKKYGVT